MKHIDLWYIGLLKKHQGLQKTLVAFSVNFVGKEIICQIKKCEFWLPRIIFLGHVISKEGVYVDPKRLRQW